MTLAMRQSREMRPRPGKGLLTRFLLVGLLNTLFGYGVFWLVLALTQRAMFSLAVSTVAGVLFNFRSIGGLVFRTADPRRLGAFASVYAFLFLLNALALESLRGCGLPPAMAQAGLVLPLALLSFHLNRRFVFGAAPHADASP